jgi:hypothetical protein
LRRSCMGGWVKVSALLNTLEDLCRSCMQFTKRCEKIK